MKMSLLKQKSPGWPSIRQQLKGWSHPNLVALVKDLYEASVGNRDFLHARVEAEDDSGGALEIYRDKIVEQFFPKRGVEKLKLGEARKAIRDYRKATGNLAGTLELMLTYVETGTDYTQQFGDIDDKYYDSLESVILEIAKLFMKDGAEHYPLFRDRIRQLVKKADGIGWGYSDFVTQEVSLLEEAFAKRQR